MNTKHVPGPWYAVFRGVYKDYGDKAEKIAECEDWEEVVANAHLIAAAPDLLHELRRLIDKCLELGYYKDMENELASAEVAIKKATIQNL